MSRKVLKFYAGAVMLVIAAVIGSFTTSPSKAQTAGTSGFSYTYISTAVSTVVQSAPGTLHAVAIAGGTAGAVTVYDNASACSGTVIATIASVTPPYNLSFDLQFKNGLCVTTAQASDVTVTTR